MITIIVIFLLLLYSAVITLNQCQLVKQDLSEDPCHKLTMYWDDTGILPVVRSCMNGYLV